MQRRRIGRCCAPSVRSHGYFLSFVFSLRLFVAAIVGCVGGCQPAAQPQSAIKPAAADVAFTPPSEVSNANTTGSVAPISETVPSQPSAGESEKGSFELSVMFWNIESGGAQPAEIARQLAELPRYDIYAFSEVNANEFSSVVSALGAEYFSNLGTTGNQDRLAIAFRKDRFEFIDWYEIEKYQEWVINPGNHRSPLVYQLRDLTTQQTFAVMVNHLARGNAQVRETQAIGLREWAKSQSVPVLGVGDYNFDYDFPTAQGNPAMQQFVQDGVWKWIQPVPMVDSNWADRDKDGVDDYPDSLLDFAFVSPLAQRWPARCEVMVRPNDFPDDSSTSDHRPCLLRIQLPVR